MQAYGTLSLRRTPRGRVTPLPRGSRTRQPAPPRRTSGARDSPWWTASARTALPAQPPRPPKVTPLSKILQTSLTPDPDPDPDRDTNLNPNANPNPKSFAIVAVLTSPLPTIVRQAAWWRCLTVILDCATIIMPRSGLRLRTGSQSESRDPVLTLTLALTLPLTLNLTLTLTVNLTIALNLPKPSL